jgi:ketosteroid isomerase-like protein
VRGGENEVGAVLDALHDAASKADGARYFSLYAPEAVFLGTDESERWTLAEFRAYAEPIFGQGKGWTYRSTQRHIVMQAGGWASFDELLENAKYGTCRGSGSLRRTSAGWKIVQYNLSVPVPNEQLEEFAGRIRAFKAARPAAGLP